MLLDILSSAFVFLSIVSICAGGLTLLRGDRKKACLLFSLNCWLLCVANLLDGEHRLAALSAIVAVFYLWVWWRNGGGKDLKKAARELGEKSAARIRRLVEQLTPSPIPAPLGGAA